MFELGCTLLVTATVGDASNLLSNTVTQYLLLTLLKICEQGYCHISRLLPVDEGSKLLSITVNGSNLQ